MRQAPAFQFYPADWRKDPGLRACSMAARGLWIELMCIAHESDEYGVLALNGRAMSPEQIARLVGESIKATVTLLKELEEAGVFSRDDKGAIYSRRMRADEQTRVARINGGRAGAEFGNRGAEFRKLGGRPPAARGVNSTDKITPLKPPPSSSSSSSVKAASTTTVVDPPAAAATTVDKKPAAALPHGEKPKPRAPDPTANPDCSAVVRRWELDRGVKPSPKMVATNAVVKVWQQSALPLDVLTAAYAMALDRRRFDGEEQTSINPAFLQIFIDKAGGKAPPTPWNESATGIENMAVTQGVEAYTVERYPGGWQEFKAAVLAAAEARESPAALTEADPSSDGEKPEAGDWWDTQDGIVEEGNILGVVSIAGQDFEEYTARVLAASEGGLWQEVRPDLEDRIAYYRRAGINPAPRGDGRPLPQKRS